MGIIYLLTAPNGKQYIGQTTQTFTARMSKHVSAAKNLSKVDGCRYLNNAIRKYGWSNFTKEILLECDNKLLNNEERRFINNYNTLAPNGYNLTTGGDSHKVSDITRYKMRESALKRDSISYRKSDASRLLPKYVTKIENKYQVGYRIAKHPNCSCKYFTNKDKTMEENYQDTIKFLDKLNNGDVTVIIPKRELPKGLQHTKGGYRVHYINSIGVRQTKLFTNSSIPKEVRLCQAKKHLDMLIKVDKNRERSRD